jgi:hypothetical protein
MLIKKKQPIYLKRYREIATVLARHAREDFYKQNENLLKEEIISTRGIIGLVLAVSLLLSAPIVLAMHGGEHGPPWGGWRGSEGWGMGQRYQRMYNPETVETLSGEVLGVEKITPMERMSAGVHVLLKTEGKTIPVHLGPVWFIERQDVRIKKGDKIEVTGSKVMMRDKPTIIAAEMKKGDEVLILRDEDGIPVWSGWRRGE